MPDDPLSEMADELLTADVYLSEVEEQTRQAVVDQLNARLFGHAGPHDLFSLVLVMLDIRPACIISVSQPALSPTQAEKMTQNHNALTTCDLVGQFLDAHTIPYVLTTNSSEGWPNEPAQAHLNYHVSFDEQRLTDFETPLPDDNDSGPGLTRREEEALGRLLAYPEPAIQAYCDGEHLSEGKLFETLSEAAIADALGPLSDLYDTLDLDYREFTTLLLPYVIPATVDECLDRAVRDVGRFIGGGLVAAEAFEITIFNQVIADYRDRFAPDRE